MLGGTCSGRPKRPPRITFDPGSIRCRTCPEARSSFAKPAGSALPKVTMFCSFQISQQRIGSGVSSGLFFPEFAFGPVAKGRPAQERPPGLAAARGVDRFDPGGFGEPWRRPPDEGEDADLVLRPPVRPRGRRTTSRVRHGRADGSISRPGERQPDAGDVGLRPSARSRSRTGPTAARCRRSPPERGRRPLRGQRPAAPRRARSGSRVLPSSSSSSG